LIIFIKQFFETNNYGQKIFFEIKRNRSRRLRFNDRRAGFFASIRQRADHHKRVWQKKILITIFQRGAVDGLNMIVPHGDGEYYNLRRTIAVQSLIKRKAR
jgi:hypothetical protein